MLRSGLSGPRLNRSVTSGDWVTGMLPHHPLKIQGFVPDAIRPVRYEGSCILAPARLGWRVERRHVQITRRGDFQQVQTQIMRGILPAGDLDRPIHRG